MNAHVNKLATVGIALLLALTLTPTRPARAVNDHIFPAAPAAKAFSDFDARGFIINGKRTFLVSAGMEYARVPRALWRDRLLRLKRAGFNCVEMYNFWDWHEPQEGKFDFTGDHDLDAFLKLIKSLDMYAICRVGPYYCAEWDNGGYPLWLNFKPGIKVRTDDPVFEAAVDKFFDKLIPIVAANQINHGGSVVLVQLENEHPQGWGTDEPTPYFKHLQDKAVALGIQVPYFFSGLHHANDPAGNSANLDDPTRPNPWMSTEFWSVWYDHYGPGPTDPATYDRRTWKIIAHGGNGYNFYMAHGGTNFAYTNDDEDAASYDYGAAVGQAGDLRPLYYTFKRAALFARSFQDVLENSLDDTADFSGAAGDTGLKVTARRSTKDLGPDGKWMAQGLNPDPGGVIMFVDNPSNAPVSLPTSLTGFHDPLTVAPGELRPIVRDYPLPTVPGVTLSGAITRIYAIVPQGDTTTIIITGAPGGPAELHFTAPATAKVQEPVKGQRETAALSQFPDAPGTITLLGALPTNSPASYSFTVGSKRVRILAVPDALADRTWPVDVNGQTYIVCGPAYIGDAKMTNGKLSITTEQPWQDNAIVKHLEGTSPVVAYGSGDTPMTFPASLDDSRVRPVALTLGAWQTLDASAPAATNFNDADWKTSATPLPMGADGDLTADAWYRAKLSAASGTYTLQLGRVRDRYTAFLDGKPLPAAPSGLIPVTLIGNGAHTLAVFAAHDGRAKLYNFLGDPGAFDPKGLTGAVTLLQGAVSGPPLSGWRILPLARAPRGNPRVPAAGAAGWTDYTVGADAFTAKPGYAWFQTTLPSTLGAGGGSLHLESVDDNATVFLNGTNIGRHTGWDQSFDVPLGTAWNAAGPNVLTLLVQNTSGTGGIDKPVTVTTYSSQTPVTGWKLRGGPGDPLATTGWISLAQYDGKSFGGPQFFRTTFTAAPPPAIGPHPIWRVITTGLGHGNVWVNGHNLGRYPEKIPINGEYIPESWLTSGANSLVIYDEDGKRPDGVTLQAETAASRDVIELTAGP